METTLGVIEGFYGRLYSKEQRTSLMQFLSMHNYSYYIYAPKNDISLRKEWKKPFTDDQIDSLKEMSNIAYEQNLDFGVGISPLKITENFDSDFSLLMNKVDVLTHKIGVKIIAILFDDIKLYTDDEGQKQQKIVNEVFKRTRDCAVRVIFCPTYYSFDPILEKLFGEAPKNYFKDLTAGLMDEIEIFWTGNKVLSKSIEKEDIEKINRLLGRKVTIWDNYPVNDGKKISTYLYTEEFKNRDNLDGVVQSHAVNPMLEANLSKIALSTLPCSYKNESKAKTVNIRDCTISTLFNHSFGQIMPYLELLNEKGLDGLDEPKRKALYELCRKIATPSADEICEFLDGVYAFDPACLTS